MVFMFKYQGRTWRLGKIAATATLYLKGQQNNLQQNGSKKINKKCANPVMSNTVLTELLIRI